MCLQSWKWQAPGLHGSAVSPLGLCSSMIDWWFCGTVLADETLILLPAPGTLFLLLGFLVQLPCEGFILVLLYVVLLCICILVVVSWRPAPRERKMELIQRRGIERFVWKEWKKRNLWLGCKKNLSSV